MQFIIISKLHRPRCVPYRIILRAGLSRTFGFAFIIPFERRTFHRCRKTGIGHRIVTRILRQLGIQLRSAVRAGGATVKVNTLPFNTLIVIIINTTKINPKREVLPCPFFGYIPANLHSGNIIPLSHIYNFRLMLCLSLCTDICPILPPIVKNLGIPVVTDGFSPIVLFIVGLPPVIVFRSSIHRPKRKNLRFTFPLWRNKNS